MWEVSGGRGKQTAPDLQDNCQGANPEADRADRDLGLGSVQEEEPLSFGPRRPQGLALWPAELRGVLDDPKPHLLLKCGP